MGKLLQKEPDLNRLFDLSLDLLCIAGLDGYFKKVNPAFETTLGFTSQELMSKPLIEFVHPDDREITLKELESLAQGKSTIHLENRHLCKNGAFKWLSWKANVDDGVIFATARNVTGLKETQESLKRSEKKLRDLVENSPFCIQEIDLNGYSLSDSATDPYQWTFPDIKLKPQQRLIVFLSGKNRAGSGVINLVRICSLC